MSEYTKALKGVIGALNRAYEETSAFDLNGYHLASGSIISNLVKQHFSHESVVWALKNLEERGLIVINHNPFQEYRDAISIKKWIDE